jgi:hypothetical protein
VIDIWSSIIFQIMENAREIFADRLKNAEARILTDSREQRKKYSSKGLESGLQ